MEPLRRAVAWRLLQVLLAWCLQAAILLLGSGDLAWPGALVYLGTYALLLVVNATILLPRHKELIAERGRLATGERWDKLVSTVFGVLGLATLLVAAIDHHLRWSLPWPLGALIVGVLLLAAGWGLFTWAMARNPFFSSLVRIQTERGHYVVTDGPYRFVRHPGYLGQVLSMAGTVLVLGSWWCIVPAALTVGVILLRTALEDRTLQRGLQGYFEYTRRTRSRLVPGVW